MYAFVRRAYNTNGWFRFLLYACTYARTHSHTKLYMRRLYDKKRWVCKCVYSNVRCCTLIHSLCAPSLRSFVLNTNLCSSVKIWQWKYLRHIVSYLLIIRLLMNAKIKLVTKQWETMIVKHAYIRRMPKNGRRIFFQCHCIDENFKYSKLDIYCKIWREEIKATIQYQSAVYHRWMFMFHFVSSFLHK